MNKRAAVVGAGIGGLSAATLLAHAGWEVDLYEQQSYVGGKAGCRTLGNYRFDTGPSLVTMPWVFKNYFASLGLEMDQYLKLIPLEPICNYFYPDGTRLSAFQDVLQRLNVMRNWSHPLQPWCFSGGIKEHSIPEDPTIYVNITSKCNPHDAPSEQGQIGENWFVLVNAPPHRGQDWDTIAPYVKGHVLARLSRELGRDIERDTGSTMGSL